MLKLFPLGFVLLSHISPSSLLEATLVDSTDCTGLNFGDVAIIATDSSPIFFAPQPKVTEVNEKIVCTFQVQLAYFQRAEIYVIGTFYDEDQVVIRQNNLVPQEYVYNETCWAAGLAYLHPSDIVNLTFTTSALTAVSGAGYQVQLTAVTVEAPVSGAIYFSPDFATVVDMMALPRNVLFDYRCRRDDERQCTPRMYCNAGQKPDQVLTNFYVYHDYEFFARISEYLTIRGEPHMELSDSVDISVLRFPNHFPSSEAKVICVFTGYENISSADSWPIVISPISSGNFTLTGGRTYRMIADLPYNAYETLYISDIFPDEDFSRLDIYANCAVAFNERTQIASITNDELKIWTPLMLRGRCKSFRAKGGVTLHLTASYHSSFSTVTAERRGVLISDAYLSAPNILLVDTFHLSTGIQTALFEIEVFGLEAEDNVTLTAYSESSQKSQLILANKNTNDSVKASLFGSSAQISYSLSSTSSGVLIKYHVQLSTNSEVSKTSLTLFDVAAIAVSLLNLNCHLRPL